jgi:hypothetical protein
MIPTYMSILACIGLALILGYGVYYTLIKIKKRTRNKLRLNPGKRKWHHV